jgi:hypothetical protein
LILDTNAITVTSFPTIPPSKHLSILTGTEPWCWGNVTEPYFQVDFGAYSVICALNVSQFKKMVTLSYGNESSKTFQVYNIHI